MSRPTIKTLLLSVVLFAASAAGLRATSLSFTFGSSSGQEDVTLVGVEVTLDSEQSGPVSVHVARTGGTAVVSDVEATGVRVVLPPSDVITFKPGETKKEYVFEVVDDKAVEGDQTVIFDLQSPTPGITLGTPSRHTYTVIENDAPKGKPGPGLPKMQFASETSKVNESSTTVELLIKADRLIDEFDTQPVQIEVEPTTGTATLGEDFKIEPLPPLVFAENDILQPVKITIVDDKLSEEDETINFRLLNPEHCEIGTTSLHTLTITDNDPAAVRWDISETTISERQSTFTLKAILANAADREVRAKFTLVGTATGGGTDYTARTASPLVFAEGTTVSALTFSIIDDHEEEPTENIIATLQADTGTTLGTPAIAQINLRDSGPWPKAHFVDSAVSRSEAITSGTVDVAIDRVSSDTVEVYWAVDRLATTAILGADYNGLSGVVKFAPGETTKSLALQIINDNIEEPDETIGLYITDVKFGLKGDPTTFVYTILDNDEPLKPLSLFTQELPTSDKDRLVKMLGPLTFGMNPAGLGLDAAGMCYISDQGPGRGPGEGRIVIVSKEDKEAVAILKNLDRPGDVELTPDQRTMLILGSDGSILKKALGLSIYFKNIDPTGNMTVTLKTDTGTYTAKASDDRYFHFLGLLENGQTSSHVTMIVERDGRSKSYQIELGNPPTGTLAKRYGHRIIKMDYKE